MEITCKRMKLYPYSHHAKNAKVNYKDIKSLYVRAITIKLLEENIGISNVHRYKNQSTRNKQKRKIGLIKIRKSAHERMLSRV